MNICDCGLKEIRKGMSQFYTLSLFLDDNNSMAFRMLAEQVRQPGGVFHGRIQRGKQGIRTP